MPEPIDIANAGPPTLDHVIGQRQAVEQLRVSLGAYWAERSAGRPSTFGGVLMAGPPGTGKSTLARILASELGATLSETLGQTLGMGEDLHAVLLECTDDTVLFVDEAEQLSSFAQTTLYKAVEERVLLVPKGPMCQRYTRVPLSRFTIVLATNHASGIAAPLRDRMSHSLHFDYYSVAELSALCRQRAGAMHWAVGRLHESQVLRVVKQAGKRAGVTNAVSPHWFRHAHASHALDRGAPVHLVQATLGHSDLSTTGRYLHARPTDGSARYLPL